MLIAEKEGQVQVLRDGGSRVARARHVASSFCETALARFGETTRV